MIEKQPPVIVYPRHAVLDALYKDNPHPSWEEMLNCLIEIFPQVEGGQVQYLIEGGVAVHLLRPVRQTPNDVDIVLRGNDHDTWRKFSGTPSKSAQHWLELRRIPGSEENIRFLFNHATLVDFNGKPVYVLDPVALAFSKSVDLNHNPPRPKDLQDVELLGVPTVQIEEFAAGFAR